jgi:MFS transporter, ACS family, hexuronate transporter
LKTELLAPTATLGRYRWVVCSLLFFATAINYIDRQILSLIKEILDRDLGWTATDFGRVNSAFQGAYGLSLLFFGWFVDRFGTKVGYSVSIAAWSVMAIAHSFVGSANGFLCARIGIGLGEGGNFPAAIKATALWFPKRERALATSLFNSGANVGALAAPAIVPAIALTWGWHWAFILAGAAGMVWLVIWMAVYKNPVYPARLCVAEYVHIRSDTDKSGSDDDRHFASSWVGLLRYRQAWAFIFAKFMTDPAWWFFLIWLPDMFRRNFGLDITKSWSKLVAVYAIITVLGIVGGWITGHLIGRGWSITRARKTGMLLFAICVLPVAAVTHIGVWPAVLLIGLAGAAHQAWAANLWSTVSDMFPKSAIARITGLGGLAGAMGGMIFPLYCGYVLDSFRAKGNEFGAYTHLLHLCAVAYLTAFVIHHWLAPRFERVRRIAI